MTMPVKISELGASMSAGETIDLSSKSYGFVMANGYSVNLFYNPLCLSDSNEARYSQDNVCVNVIYDMNGLRGPNKVGKDIGFVTILYPDEQTTAVTSDVYKSNAKNASFYKAGASYANLDNELTVPNREELTAIRFNGNVVGFSLGSSWYWSSSEHSAWLGWLQRGDGLLYGSSKSDVLGVRCIRR